MRGEGRVQDASIIELLGIHLVIDTAAGHDHDTVAEIDELHHLRRNHDHRAAAAG